MKGISRFSFIFFLFICISISAKNKPTISGMMNGYGYVDLGLPSGTMWATCNVGASKPEEFGDYFAWGETSPKTIYSRENYAYKLNPITLPLEQDAANVNMGGTWQMPTVNEIRELQDKCKWEWTKYKKSKGWMVTGPNGNSIFFPAAGYRFYNAHHGIDLLCYSTKNIYFDKRFKEYNIGLTSSSYNEYQYVQRFSGQSIRAVYSPESNAEQLANESVSYIPEPELLTAESIKSPTGTQNGYNYVDLGLPSGVMWATNNIGANKPEDYGYLFSWGETKNKNYFSSNDLDYSYKENPKVLPLSNDAAHYNWGSGWRMPTKEDADELLTKCTWTWAVLNDVFGYKISGPNGNFIFLPATGSIYNGTYRSNEGLVGAYWTSTIDNRYTSSAFEISFNWLRKDCWDFSRHYGVAIRPVTQRAQTKKTDKSGSEDPEKLYQKWVKLFEEVGFTDEVKKYFYNAALKGHAGAQYIIGEYYSLIEDAPSKAFSWYLKAAEQGHVEAMYTVGDCYDCGYGVKENYTEAIKWFRKAAEEDHPKACFYLGEYYYNGKGISKSIPETIKWWTKAAELGWTSAQYNLGTIYYIGDGVKQDYEIAAKWYKKAANQNHGKACYQLGIMYFNGEGVDLNPNKGLMWIRSAAEYGSQEAKDALKAIEKRTLEKKRENGI